MNIYRIDDRVIAFTQGGPLTWTVTAGPPGPTYPPVSTGRLWLNTDFSAQDWGRDSLFLDVMRTARPWRAQTATEFDDATLRAVMMAAADADGYPTMLPAGVTQAGTFVLMEQAAESAPAIGGRYRLEWQGSGTVAVSGANQASGTNAYGSWIEFDYTPTGSNSVDVRITSTTTGNHVRGMRCYMTAHAALIAQGRRVHPAFMAAWGGIKLLRFMLAQNINVSEQELWSDAPQPSSICRGVSWREMVDICNELGCNGWFHIPHRATAAYVTQAATVVRDHLNPALKAYVEYSNELWNFAFGFNANPYLEALRSGKTYNFMEQGGGRSTETMIAWSAVFAGQMSRTVRVAGVQTGWMGLEQDFLYAPGWVAEVPGRVVPHTVHDAIAVTGYFNVPAGQWAGIITAAEANYATGRDLLITRVREDIAYHRDTLFPYHRGVANTLGKDLIMYEGGSHMENPGGLSNPTLVNQLVNEVNTGPLVYDLYDRMMRAWDDIGDGGFNQFSATRRPQTTGAFGAQHYINDFTQPRYDALQDYNDGALPTAGIVALPLNQRIVIGGHSITDAIARTPLTEAISAMGGAVAKWTATGPHTTMLNRWNNPVSSGTPDNIKALMEAGGADYDAFVTIEAHGGSYGGRASVVEHMRWSESYALGVQWMNLAASAGAQTYLANFWRTDSAQVFDAAWRNSHTTVIWTGGGGGDTRAANLTELQAWDNLIDTINANRAGGTPVVRLVPWLQVYLAVWDAISAGTVTGITMADIMSDDVHPDTAAGRWILLATLMVVVYRRHPDTLPANAGTQANISAGLAAQLRPIIWATCLATPRTGFSA